MNPPEGMPPGTAERGSAGLTLFSPRFAMLGICKKQA